MPVDLNKHRALDLPKEDRIAYLKVVASLAAADGAIGDREIGLIRSACEDFGLDGQEIDGVVAVARDPEQAEIQRTVESLKESPLRFTLLADLTFVAHADGRYTKEERIEIVEISQILNTTYDQLIAVDRYVEAKRKGGKAAAGAPPEFMGFNRNTPAGLGAKNYLGIKWLAAKIGKTGG